MKKLLCIFSITLTLIIFSGYGYTAQVSADAPVLSRIVKNGQLVPGTSGNFLERLDKTLTLEVLAKKWLGDLMRSTENAR